MINLRPHTKIAALACPGAYRGWAAERESDMEPLVLTVDMAGLPQAWVELEEAVVLNGGKHGGDFEAAFVSFLRQRGH